MGGRLVVVGGDAAGMAAASQARRLDGSLDIVVLELGRYTSYSACGIPYLVGGEVRAVDDLVARTPQEFRDKQRIDVRMRHEAMAIDLDKGTVEVRSHERDRTFSLAFDDLHLGTGACPLRPPLPGIDLPFVHGVQTLGDATDLLRHLGNPPPWAPHGIRRAVVVGGGYIGLEMGEALHRRGIAVTIVTDSPEVMPTLDVDMGARCTRALRALGLEVRTGTRVEGFEKGEVHLADGGRIPADLVVLGLGVSPNARLAEEAGIELGAKGAVRVDRRQRTSHEAVWAAGDCATTRHIVSGEEVHIALGTVANKTARVAGTNIGGGYATFAGVVGTALTKVCDLEVARTGLNEAEAAAAGFVGRSATIASTAIAGYLPDPSEIHVKLVVEDGTDRILGGQIVGGPGSAKRIDTLAIAVTVGWTTSDLVAADLGYAPPFSPLWDPVQVAARRF